jgi:Xaa-Pro aminopeptidase
MKRYLISLFIALLITSGLMVNAQSSTDYERRQQSLMNETRDGMVIIYASTTSGVLNKNFYYLTGKDDLSMVLVLCSECEEKVQLYAATKEAGHYPVEELGDRIGSSLSKFGKLWVSLDDSERTRDIRNLYIRESGIQNLDPLFYRMREIKDDEELEMLKKAVEITSEAYNLTIKTLSPGVTEQAVIDAFKKKQLDLGAQSTSFIQAGSGVNGTQIHATPTEKVIEKGDLVVFDVGAWYNRYTSDISRTFPASGKFTKAQKKIYQLVLDAQKAAIEKMVTGMIMRDVQLIVEDILITGLFNLGLITDVKSSWQRGLYLVHGYYHYIGLDIHDLYPSMSRETATKKYEPGMIMTMEPGLYFPPTLLDKKPARARNVSDEEFAKFVNATRKNYLKYVNIGVRIEDDILITPEGNVVLSSAVPKEIKDIEKAMK